MQRIYIYMTNANGEIVEENNFRYLAGQEFTVEDCVKVSKAHSKLNHSTGFYVFMTATETKGEWNAFT